MDRLDFFRFEDINNGDRDIFNQYYKFCKQNKRLTSEYYAFGYEAFGVVLYKFCTWLMNDLSKEGINRILFFSRDGYIIQQAFKLIPGSDKYSTEYLYVSRRSLRVPSLWFGEESKYEKIFPTRFISIRDLISSVGLNPDKYAEIVKKYGFSLEYIARGEHIDLDSNLSDLVDEIWPDVISNSKEEYEKVIGYIKQHGIKGRIAVVDIGWRGTMQRYLNKLIDKADIHSLLRGYYITLNSDLVHGYDMHGYLGNVDGNSKGCDKLRGYVGLIETLFLRTEGSTFSYERNSNGNIEPVLDDYEYMDNGEMSWEAQSVLDIQRGALDFIEDYVGSNNTFLNRFSDELSFHNLDMFAKKPSLRDVKLFSEFRFFNNGTVSHLAQVKSISYYLLHPLALKKDFYESRWRIGFMKNLFKIPLPYNGMMNIIMRYVKRGRT